MGAAQSFTLIHADTNGVTHLTPMVWDMTQAEFTPPSPAGYSITDFLSAQGVLMMHHPAGYRDAWHCAPAPVLGTVLSGIVRIDVSDGQYCILNPGDQFVAADLTGKGHKMEEAQGRAYNLALVVLDEAPHIPRSAL